MPTTAIRAIAITATAHRSPAMRGPESPRPRRRHDQPVARPEDIALREIASASMRRTVAGSV